MSGVRRYAKESELYIFTRNKEIFTKKIKLKYKL